MPVPDPIESIMARMMPPALSQEGHASMEALIDDLANSKDSTKKANSQAYWGLRVAMGGGIAAALGGLCALWPLGSSESTRTVTIPAPANFSGLVLLGEPESAGEGRTEVRREGDFYKVKVRGPQGQMIFDGKIFPGDDFNQIPAASRRKVQVLCKTLDQALDGNAPQREPRPRGLPSSVGNP